MPIDPKFPKPYRITADHKHADRDCFYLVWGPETAAEAAENEVKRSSQVRAEHANLRLHEKGCSNIQRGFGQDRLIIATCAVEKFCILLD